MATNDFIASQVELQVVLDQISLNTDVLMEISADNVNTTNEEFLQYLTYKDGWLATVEDSCAEKKIAFAYLTALNKQHPDASSETKKDLCEQVINKLREFRIQYWFGTNQIDHTKYKTLCKMLKRAIFVSKLKYRARTASIGGVIGVVVALFLHISTYTPVSIAIGVILGLVLPKETIEKIKKVGKEEILPQLKMQLKEMKFTELSTTLHNGIQNILNANISKIERFIGNSISRVLRQEEVEVQQQEQLQKV